MLSLIAYYRVLALTLVPIVSSCLLVFFLIYAFPEFISSCFGDIYVFCVLVVTFIISINLSSVMVYLDFVCCSLFFVIDVS